MQRASSSRGLAGARRRYEMDDLFAILVGAGLAGGALLLVKRKQAAPVDPPKGSTACDVAKAAAEAAGLPFSSAVCEGVLGVGAKIADVLLTDSGAENAKEVSRRDAINTQLNGATEIKASAGGYQGSTLRFVNGCVPFAGAPGFAKCKPGTLSMWRKDTHPKGARDYTGAAFPTTEAKNAWYAANRDYVNSHGQMPYGLNADEHAGAMFTGSADPKRPDPTTKGYVVNGKWFGFVKGVRVECPAGQAPALWDKDGNPIRDQRDGVPPCAPGGVSTFIPSTVIPPTQIGESVQTQLSCGPGGTAPAGYTWDPAGAYWRRLRAGETPNAGPCNQNVSTSGLLTPIQSSSGGRL